MRSAIDTALAACGGVGGRRELLRIVDRRQLDDEIRRGALVRIAPHAYVRPWEADQLAIVELAALKSTAGMCALSHTTALRRRGLPVPRDQPIHLTAITSQRPRSRAGVRVHRTNRPMATTVIDGAATVSAPLALVESWPLLASADRRAPVIRAVTQRSTSPSDLRAELARHTRLRDRSALLALVGLIEAGCQSELELWGYLNVFDIAGLRGAIRQRTVVVRGQLFRLDLAYEHEKVAVELDGREYHSSSAQWEKDIARDLALATVGWQTVRLSHRRLTTDVEGCRRDVLAVLGQRIRR